MLSTGMSKKTLDLVGVQVHGQQTVDAGAGQHVGDQPRRDGDPR